jgi:hypothetical protein
MRSKIPQKMTVEGINDQNMTECTHERILAKPGGIIACYDCGEDIDEFDPDVVDYDDYEDDEEN